MIRMVTFTDEKMTISARICQESAHRNGVNSSYVWHQSGLKQTDFYKQNKTLLDKPKGCGYYSWKPFVILDSLNRCNENDILIYSDCGVEFVGNVNYIIDRMDQDIFLFSNKFQHAHWCKADIPKAITGACDWATFDKQVQASVIFFKVNERSKEFASEWLRYCLIPGLVDDSPSKIPNHPEFQENRWDQAILTTLAYREGIRLHWWPAMYNAGVFQYEKTGYKDTYPILFHHHRRRNDEWAMKDELNLHITNYFKRKYSYGNNGQKNIIGASA